MHDEAKHFTEYVKHVLPKYFENKTVLDVGSGDLNGNNRFLFVNCNYNGNDVINAPNVTIVSKTKDLPFSNEYFDTIISTECFEHDAEYKASLKKIYDILKPEGLFLFTCAGIDRPEHGTLRSKPFDSYATIARLPEYVDYYYNLTEKDIDNVLNLNNSFVYWQSYYNSNSKDLYFVGIKKHSINSDYKHIPAYNQDYVICTTQNI
jgi:SAM-dependent methyltransferase